MSGQREIVKPTHHLGEEGFELGVAESLQAYDLTEGVYEYSHPEILRRASVELKAHGIIRDQKSSIGMEASTAFKAEGVAGQKVQKVGDKMGGGLEKGSIGSKTESMTGEQKK